MPLAIRGGMVSTFNDYLRFLMMLRNLGELDGVRILRKETVQLMCCNHIPVACNGKKTVYVFDKPGMGYSCLGSIQSQNPKQDRGTVSGEYGWGGLAGPAWTIDPRSDLIVLSMTQTALVLDHEEYLRYTARRAISQYFYGSVTGPSKATSYHPECFDVIKPVRADVTKDQNTDQEFEEEHRIRSKTRVRGVKECAILPGARLDRHPSDEAAPVSQKSDEKGTDVLEEATPSAKRQRRSNPETPSEAIQKGGASPPSGGKKDKGDKEEKDLLFSRVALPSNEGDDAVRKARVTKVNRTTVEVVREADWSTQKVKLQDISVIEETQFGISNVQKSDPTDFPMP